VSLRPIDWQLTMWNVEQKAPEVRDRQAAVVPAAQQQEAEKDAQIRQQQVQQSDESGTDRPLEDAKDKPDREKGRGGRKKASPRGQGTQAASSEKRTSSDGGGFDFYA